MSRFQAFAVVAILLLAAAPASAQTSTWTTGSYVYDGAGNIKSIGAEQYRYDSFGRLVSGTVDTGSVQTATYDAFGNIITLTTNGYQQRLGVDPATNRASLSSSPYNAFGTYDAAGRLIATADGVGNTFTYDAGDMVTRSNVEQLGTRIHLYTANDERIATITVASGAEVASEWTLRDASGKVLRRLQKAGAQWAWKEDYVYRGSDLLAAEVDTAEQSLHFFPDHLGTPRLITANGGAKVASHTYYPFGEEATPTSQDAEKLQFTGHERDAESVDYMHARYYGPKWGRFLSVDPTWESADLGTPQSWNRYSYVLNNPVRYTDPDGRCGTVWTCAVWGARAGSTISVPGTVIGIVAGVTLGYGITHPNEVAALGNTMGGGSAGERFAENWIRQNNANHMAEQADLPELPARDATGKVHTNEDGLPTAEDLQKYPTEDLEHFQDELKGSVGERVKTTSSLPDQTKEQRVKHGERQAEEQRLIKAIDKIIKDRSDRK